MKIYSFCENINNPALGHWHIRKLTEKGQRLGGGCDTLALCGRKVHWDLDVPFSFHHLEENCCLKCANIYREAP